MTYLQAAFIKHLKIQRITQSAYAERHNVDLFALNRFVNHGILTKQIKNVIFTGWPTKTIKIDLIDNHFKDEIESAGAFEIIGFKVFLKK